MSNEHNKAPAVPVAWWIPKAEQFCLAKPSGERPFAKAWEPLYAAPTSQEPAVPQVWKLVRTPITEEMHVAAVKVLHRAPGLAGLPQRMLDAMLAATPSAPSQEPEPIEVTDAMALAFHNALSDGSIGQSDVDEIRIGLKAALSHLEAPAPAVPPLPHPVAHIDLGDDTEDVFTSDQLFSYIGAWRELCRRLYVELWHCDKQMTSTLNEDDEPMWTTGSTVSDVLKDARLALDTTPAAPSQEPAISQSFDEVWDSIDWNEWRMRSIRDLVQMIHSRTTAAPSQEPVNRPQNCGTSYCSCIECLFEPAQEPVTLTDDEIAVIWSRHARLHGDEAYTLRNHVLRAARDIIAALREKQGGV